MSVQKIVNILWNVVVFSFMHYGLYLQNPLHYRCYTDMYPPFLWYAMSVVWMVSDSEVRPVSHESVLLSVVQSIYFGSVLMGQL
jgi:dolichyl-phosphate-mannose--protein O-mannosyl transferase